MMQHDIIATSGTGGPSAQPTLYQLTAGDLLIRHPQPDFLKQAANPICMMPVLFRFHPGLPEISTPQAA